MKRIGKLCFFACFLIVIFFSVVSAANDGSPAEENGLVLQERQENGVFVLPGSLLVIEEDAFLGTQATEVVLPEGVEVINDRAFANMPGLERINIPESVSHLGSGIFLEDHHVTIYGIPGGKAEAYAQSSGLDFQDIRSLMPAESIRLPKVRQLQTIFYLCQALLLAFILPMRLTGRRICEAKPIRRKKRIELHCLDAYFP